MDKLSFQGRIALITSPEKCLARIQNVNARSSRFANMSAIKLGTSRICDVNDGDLFVLVHNGQEGILRRLKYGNQSSATNFVRTVREDICHFGSNLKENITCLVLGGRSNDMISSNCVNRIVENLDGDISIISGVTNEVKSPMFIAHSKTSKIPEIYVPTKIEGKVSEDKLEKVYDIVELNNAELVG